MRPGLFPIMLNIRKIIRAFMSFSLGLMCIMCTMRFTLVLKDSKDNAFYEEIRTITKKTLMMNIFGQILILSAQQKLTMNKENKAN